MPNDDFFTVYPNPFTGSVQVLSVEEIIKVEVLDANGKVLIEKNTDMREPLDLHAFSAGTYRIRVTFSDYSIQDQLLVKQ